jgi:hypothetical protein
LAIIAVFVFAPGALGVWRVLRRVRRDAANLRRSLISD